MLGKADIPPVLISELFDIFAGLVADQLQGKNADQVKRWTAPRNNPVRNLLEVVGDINLRDVTREQAYNFDIGGGSGSRRVN